MVDFQKRNSDNAKPQGRSKSSQERQWDKERELFLSLVASGCTAASTAAAMGIPVNTVRLWMSRLRQIASDLRCATIRRPRDVSSRPLVTGITLVHSCDITHASAGDFVTFSSWIMNDTTEDLHGVSLIPRSFTNAGMESLCYLKQPTPNYCRIGHLKPGETATRTFTYRVTEADVRHGGEIISAMGVVGTTENSESLWDECDAAAYMDFPACQGFSDSENLLPADWQRQTPLDSVATLAFLGPMKTFNTNSKTGGVN